MHVSGIFTNGSLHIQSLEHFNRVPVYRVTFNCIHRFNVSLVLLYVMLLVI